MLFCLLLFCLFLFQICCKSKKNIIFVTEIVLVLCRHQGSNALSGRKQLLTLTMSYLNFKPIIYIKNYESLFSFGSIAIHVSNVDIL